MTRAWAQLAGARRALAAIPLAARRGAPQRALSVSPCVLARSRLPRAAHIRETELQHDIAELEAQLRLVEKRQAVEQATKDLPPLDEDTLEEIYRDLLVAPQPADRPALGRPERPAALIADLDARLCGEHEAQAAEASAVDRTPEPLLEGVRTGAGTPGAANGADVAADVANATSAPLAEPAAARRTRRQRILERVQPPVSDTHDAPDSASSGALTMLPDVAPEEWEALAIESARDHDFATTREILAVMRKRGEPPASSWFHSVMDAYAVHGGVTECMELGRQLTELGLPIDAPVKHALVKANANAGLLYPALALLSHWEASEAASIKTYSLAIDALLKHPVRAVHSVAWSLFYRMRFAAHPVPDAALYTLMIRACAAGVPQPGAPGAYEADTERALDLFREMTTRHGIRPNKEVYDTLILACARRREHYADAIRLLRELLDDEQAAVLAPGGGAPPLWADTYTFNALLQGCARTGDLRIARWVLAEMVRSVYDGAPATVPVERRQPNEETLTNLFWTYAVYKPPLLPEQLAEVSHANQVEGGAGAARAAATAASGAETAVASPAAEAGHEAHSAGTDAVSSPEEGADDGMDAAPLFTLHLPQTSREVLTEARSLMARILADQPAANTSGASPEHPLASVRVSARLLNAFLSVLVHHLPAPERLAAVLHAMEEEHEGLFAQAGVPPNVHTLVLLLQECTHHRDRALADAAADRIWERFEQVLGSTSNDPMHATEQRELGADAKTVSRMYALRIRNYAKYVHRVATRMLTSRSFDVDAGLALLRQFMERYPPPARRATSAADVPADAPSAPAIDLMPVPPPPEVLDALYRLPPARAERRRYAAPSVQQPRLTFRDLELLHHRCIALRNVPGLNLITRADREYRSVR